MTSAIQFLGIRGVIAAGLGIALAIMVWRADVIAGERDDALQALGAEKQSHATTRASVERMTDVLKRLTEAANRRAEELKDARDRASKAEQRNARLARSTDKTIQALRDLAERPGQCAVPDDIRDLADGL